MNKKRFFLILVLLIFLCTSIKILNVKAHTSDDYKTSLFTDSHFDRKSVHVKAGKSVKIEVRNYDGKIKYSTSKKKIATVNSKGVIKGKKKGRCKLWAVLDNGARLETDITVSTKLKVDNCKLYGHRGDADNQTENTVKAFKSSLKKNYDGIEMDVYLTDSGDFLVFHDLSLGRLCNKNISIYKISKKNRDKYPIINGNGKKEIIPSLDECLNALKKEKTKVFIHVKRPNRVLRNAADKELVDIVKRNGMENNVVFFCWNDVLMENLKQQGMNVGIDNEGWHRENGIKSMIDVAASKGIEYVMCLERKDINDIVVDYAHENGIKIGLYMTKTLEDAQYVNDIGGDFCFCYHDFKRK